MKAKYKFKRTCTGPYGFAHTGDVRELEQRIAEPLLKRGLVVPVMEKRAPGRPKGSGKATGPELNK